ncbi:copper resistance CopC family protein [Amycolatopsis pithecellobii]|uniref:Copper resistance protein CopC n=1 Tax=Amycolatopsis pithecellobii TaxID=664692 RepID=A0A6N7Z992_9PSEU|nr:copper resistance CopC family protein [Amycolatopsis pithecellobii]MTD58305.1 copper resistance protein CopC [Amycolatopsis pithecellobii]
MRKALAVLALAVAAMIGTATPALAHNVLISTDPAKGTALETGPAKITLIFDAPVQGGDINQISVLGPDRSQWAEGTVAISSNVVTVPVRPLGPAGTYTVGYRILSSDGHPVTGEYTFTLTKAGNGTPATAGAATGVAGSSSGSGGGVPVWVWVIGAFVLLAIGLTLALRMGREKTR